MSGAVIRVSASTTLVSIALNCGPRGSICPRPVLARSGDVMALLDVRGCPVACADGRRSREFSRQSSSTKGKLVVGDRQDIRHSDERTRQWSTARRRVSKVELMRGSLGSGGAGTYRPSHHSGTPSTSWTSRLLDHHLQRGQHLLARGGPAGAGDLHSPGGEHDRRRRAQDPEAAYDVEVVLGVDLDVRDTRRRRRPRRRARAGRPGRARRTPRRTAAAWPARPGRRPTACPSSSDSAAGASGVDGATRPRGPGGCHGTGRRSRRGTARRPSAPTTATMRTHDPCAHGWLNDGSGKRLPGFDERSSARSRRAVSRRRRAAGTRRWRRAAPAPSSGSSVVTGRSPDHHRAAGEHLGEAAGSRRAPRGHGVTSSARVTAPATSMASLSVPGGGARGGPVAQGHTSSAGISVEVRPSCWIS